MEYSETIAKIKRMGPISENREQIIELSDVGAYVGRSFSPDEFVKIYICDSKTAEAFDKTLRTV